MNHILVFPFYVCLDDGTVIQIESFEKILYHLEAIDIENNEYMFWDSNWRSLKILINKGRVSGFDNSENRITLRDAFEEYAHQLGISLDTSETPEEIWKRLQEAKENLPRPRGFLSRLLGRKPE